jgi:(2Fe-2S) ferredoxin
MSASSFAASDKASSPAFASALLFPSFKYFPSIPVDASPAADASPPDTDLSTFLRAFLLPDKLNNMYSSLPDSKRAELTRVPNLASNFPDAIDLQHSPTILICGHGGRDARCGIMAPVLEDEFRRVLRARGFASGSSAVDRPDHANVGLISHVGGHKYAGNVIVYVPPGMASNPLAGMGIWYGLVEPKHVQGIVEETVLGGRVVVDRFRGGIRRDGEILRL